jgi:transposase InsO family protein
VYGSPRIYKALKARGEGVCENTVADIMKERQIRAKSKKKFMPATTDSRHQQPIAPNALDRQFDAQRPNQKWAVDITRSSLQPTTRSYGFTHPNATGGIF